MNERGIKRAFTQLLSVSGSRVAQHVDGVTQLMQAPVRIVFTGCTQVFRRSLCIQFVSNLSDLFADKMIEFDCLFDFLDRMNRGGVIFTTEFTGNPGKAKV